MRSAVNHEKVATPLRSSVEGTCASQTLPWLVSSIPSRPPPAPPEHSPRKVKLPARAPMRRAASDSMSFDRHIVYNGKVIKPKRMPFNTKKHEINSKISGLSDKKGHGIMANEFNQDTAEPRRAFVDEQTTRVHLHGMSQQYTAFPSSKSSSRAEVLALGEVLHTMLLESKTMQEKLVAWDSAFAEVVCQVTQQCSERGQLLDCIRRQYSCYFEKFMEDFQEVEKDTDDTVNILLKSNEELQQTIAELQDQLDKHRAKIEALENSRTNTNLPSAASLLKGVVGSSKFSLAMWDGIKTKYEGIEHLVRKYQTMTQAEQEQLLQTMYGTLSQDHQFQMFHQLMVDLPIEELLAVISSLIDGITPEQKLNLLNGLLPSVSSSDRIGLMEAFFGGQSTTEMQLSLTKLSDIWADEHSAVGRVHEYMQQMFTCLKDEERQQTLATLLGILDEVEEKLALEKLRSMRGCRAVGCQVGTPGGSFLEDFNGPKLQLGSNGTQVSTAGSPHQEALEPIKGRANPKP